MYFHFPFCESKCHYCDFYSLAIDRTRPVERSGFTDALAVEWSIRRPELDLAQIDSIFFGGGTPSMTHPDDIARALDGLHSGNLKPNIEWTMEGNPSSISLANLEALKRLGLNRLSMGVQSLDTEVLKFLGRVHDRESVFRALDAAFTAGMTNVSVDFLCGLPNQTLADLERDFKALEQYPLTHLSCYLLTLAPHHPWYSKLPNEDEQLAHLLFVDGYFTSRGWVHYEISNFCRPGFESRHNLNYWHRKSYLGFGPSAHSYDAVKQVRFKNDSSLGKYTRRLISKQELPLEQVEYLTTEQLELEKWMLALRLKEGFPMDWLDNPRRRQVAERLLKSGELETTSSANRLRLTARGFALSEMIIREFC